MALTPMRWLAAFVIGCLVCSIALVRSDRLDSRQSRAFPNFPIRSAEDVLERRRNNLTGMAREAARKFRLAQVVDSLDRATARVAPSPIRIFIDGGVPAVARGPLDTLTARATASLRDSVRMGVDVFVVYDTVSRIRDAWAGIYRSVVDYVLPRRTGDRCSVVLRIGNNPKIDWMITKVIRTEQAQQQLLGPCAYYGAFGMPGPRIDAWLRGGAWKFAGDGSWATAEAPVAWRRPYYMNVFSPRFDTPLLDMSVDGAQCTSGVTAACETALFGKSSGRGAHMRFVGDNLLQSPYPPLAQSRENYYQHVLGTREPFLFADMVRMLGKARFSRFWTSTQAPAPAFQAASGESLTSWMVRWAEAEYAEAPPRGPGLGRWAALLSIALVAAGAALAVRLSAMRQFA